VSLRYTIVARKDDWRPPDDWRRVTVIDVHTGGEPFRVVTGGVPEVEGETILERRRFARERLDSWRRALLWEPPGHADMYGCYLTPPVTPGAHLGVLFLHNEGYSTMCGHGVIALVKVALETGMLAAEAPETTVRIDTPAGLVTARARVAAGVVESVRFENVPSFVLGLDQEVDVPGLGRLRYDLAFGGAFYAYLRAADAGLGCRPADFRTLIEKGSAIKRAIMASRKIEHPFEDDLGFLYGVIFVDEASAEDVHSRNVCVFADGEVDRSPTGTGVSGRLAIHYARGEIGLGERVVIESIVGSRFSGRVVSTTRFGPYDAVIPEVEGTAYIIGRQELLFDPSDPLGGGFLLR
jgi:trans-L-3-hydroxyproline dehydratase